MRPFLIMFCFLTIQITKAGNINQIGYYPNEIKIASVSGSVTDSFKILNAKTGAVIFKNNTIKAGIDASSGMNVCIADFTSFNVEGKYRLVIGTQDTSYEFAINSNCYKDALNSILKSYYYQRCGYDLLPIYAGKWDRAQGHSDDAFLTILDGDSKSYDVSGGWYDAGDFGKYVVNAGITCGTMMGLYELCPEVIDDSCLNIPESGNQQSDLLDEIKYELNWLIKMQDSDGGVFFKVGPTKWPGTVMPEEDPYERYIIGKSTTSTLDFAALMAMAGRVYKKYDLVFANNCLNLAENAWKWAVANPGISHPANTSGTGPYGDGNDATYKDEFLWALSELAISTDKSVYKDTLDSIIRSRKITGPAWWQDINNLAFFSLAVNNCLSANNALYVKDQIIAYADTIISIINSSPFRNPMRIENYTWGSNGTCGNFGVILAYAHYITKSNKYLEALILTADYLFGRNPSGYCYVTGLGSFSSLNPHHRQSSADFNTEPVPGMVVGGPNKDTSGADDYLKDIIEQGTYPALCYVDDAESWASNENAINQNAPWVLILGYLEKFVPLESSAIKWQKITQNKGREKIKFIPESKGVRIVFSSSDTPGFIKVYTLQGKCVLAQNIKSESSSFFLSSKLLGSGTLILGFHWSYGTEYSRVIIR